METLRKIVVLLSGAERSALAELAERELRDPRDQLRHILRTALQREGLLPGNDEGIGQEESVEVSNEN